MPKAKLAAEFLGLDLSTTALAVGVRGVDGKEDFVSLPMIGATEWHGQPAFDLSFLPSLFEHGLEKLQERGWVFPSGGVLSFSVRQHDMVVLGDNLQLLMPALSWQCNAATAEVTELQDMGAEVVVGKIEERFILPKAMWAFRQQPDLLERIRYVMTTGDYISLMLTAISRMSTSDALSNGLLCQATKGLANEVIVKASLKPEWFPEVIQSGRVIGLITHLPLKTPDSWKPVITTLNGWQVVAGLGDNHASGVGCGLSDSETIVASGGSSGTVVRRCSPNSALCGEAACFEYYEDRLLLMMLADCAVWYNRFVEQFGRGKRLAELDELAFKADLAKLQRVRQKQGKEGWQEVYPKGWNALPLAEKVASTQASIAIELLLLVRKMQLEVQGALGINRFVLTGGLSRSSFFQYVFQTGLPVLVVTPKLFVSDRKGPLSHQAATLGAMINAMVGAGTYSGLSSAIADLCPLKPLSASGTRRNSLWIFLQENINEG